jgi:hypothetical protein
LPPYATCSERVFMGALYYRLVSLPAMSAGLVGEGSMRDAHGRTRAGMLE